MYVGVPPKNDKCLIWILDPDLILVDLKYHPAPDRRHAKLSAANLYAQADIPRVDVDEVLERGQGLAALLSRPQHPLKHDGARVLEEEIIHLGIFS